MRRDLTIKQENFCNYYVETGNASEAYRRAYSCDGMKDETVNRRAFDLIRDGKITARIAGLQAEQKAKSDISKEEIVRLCVDVIRGKNVTDVTENRDGRKSERTISKTWAVERLCKMLGFDSATEVKLKQDDEGMSREEILEELRRLEKLRDDG